MIYKFAIRSEEDNHFYMEVKIDADNTFYDFHCFLQKVCRFDQSLITSFFLCDLNWQKKLEIHLMPMTDDFEGLIMDVVMLRELLTSAKSKLMYCYDYFNERSLLIELTEIIETKNIDRPICMIARGNAPRQRYTEISFSESEFDLLSSNDYLWIDGPAEIAKLDEFSEERWN